MIFAARWLHRIRLGRDGSVGMHSVKDDDLYPEVSVWVGSRALSFDVGGECVQYVWDDTHFLTRKPMRYTAAHTGRVSSARETRCTNAVLLAVVTSPDWKLRFYFVAYDHILDRDKRYLVYVETRPPLRVKKKHKNEGLDAFLCSDDVDTLQVVLQRMYPNRDSLVTFTKRVMQRAGETWGPAEVGARGRSDATTPWQPTVYELHAV